MSNSIISNFLSTGARAALGVAAIRTSIWGYKKIEDWTGLKIGPTLDKIPLSIQKVVYDTTVFVSTPISWAMDKVGKVSPTLNSVLTGPFLEEGLYRLVLKEGTVFLLSTMGCNPLIAEIMAIAGTSFMFGMGHTPFVSDDRFVSTMIGGVWYGVIDAKNGILEAALTHSLHNAYTAIMPKIMGSNWFEPRWQEEQ